MALDEIHQYGCKSASSSSSPAQDSAISVSKSIDRSSPESLPDEQQDLERWSREIIAALCACDFKHPIMDRLVPDFKSDHEIIEGVEHQPKTKAEYFAKHRSWAQSVPSRTMTVLQVVSEYDADKGKANVWMWLNITGWGAGRMCAEGVSWFKWKRSQDVWWCHQHTGMRGAPPIQGAY